METTATPLALDTLDSALGEATTTIRRDLFLNLKRILGEGALTPDEAAMALLALATATGEQNLARFARESLIRYDFTSEHIREAAEAAALMGMLNTYYRFRHLLKEGQGAELDSAYATAGLRMTALARPAIGKLRFEMLAFAVSVLNGCGSCITSHEKVLREGGIEPAKIHDLARLASVVRAIHTLSAVAG